MNSQIDISGILPTIRVPTLVIHRTDDVTINVEGGRYLAAHIPGARYIELPRKIIYPSSETTLERLPTLSKSF
jgi:pimeloyl-ACP methyl ester carboxylesterase